MLVIACDPKGRTGCGPCMVALHPLPFELGYSKCIVSFPFMAFTPSLHTILSIMHTLQLFPIASQCQYRGQYPPILQMDNLHCPILKDLSLYLYSVSITGRYSSHKCVLYGELVSTNVVPVLEDSSCHINTMIEGMSFIITGCSIGAKISI